MTMGWFDRAEANYYDDMYQVSKHGLRVENMPCFIPNDRSKKRLIQDTEDWQPRTGTTQSRSFRILAQLTGTDFMQDPDDENMKRAREKFLTEIQSPRYARLRDWHHDRSARALNIKS
ncbi:LOW QUALITY PROTEIN: PDZ and LIM domain protein 7-like [Lampetra planeri]